MNSIPGRVSELEQKSHTHEHRLSQLEQLPPRVGDMENSVAVINTHLNHIQATNGEIKAALLTVSDQQKEISGQFSGFSKAVKIIGGLVTLAGIGTAVVLWLQ